MNLKTSRVKSALAIGLASFNILTFGLGLGLGSVDRVLAVANIDSIPKVGPETVGGLVDVLRGVVRWVYIIFFVVAVLFILFAAFNYLTAAGDEDKVGKAKSGIIYAAIAIAIAFLAVGFETIIGTFLVTPGR